MKIKTIAGNDLEIRVDEHGNVVLMDVVSGRGFAIGQSEFLEAARDVSAHLHVSMGTL
ncbi:MAG: hypothetical protein ACTSU5_00135 [Promethearchaeota archaeon]